ncbi:MAG: SprT family zinc-dependent metalloprotease [Erythrobacter sp.]
MIDWMRREIAEPEIALGNDTIPIVLRRHPTARRLTLRLAPDGSEVRITMPKWARSAEAIAFAHSRQEWLTTQHDKIPQRTAPKPGTQLKYRGHDIRIEWHDDLPRKPILEDGVIRLGGPLHSLEARLKRWFEKQALYLFERDVAHYCDKAALPLVPVALSRAQKRWGSCSDRQKIRLNWRLVQAPDMVRRSVAAHEVTHLVHFDHSPAFHAMLRGLFEDDIRSADRWLKDQGRSLYTSFG